VTSEPLNVELQGVPSHPVLEPMAEAGLLITMPYRQVLDLTYQTDTGFFSLHVLR
jgi:hypothetical protein